MPKKNDPTSQKSEEAPQCPEDARGPDYDNTHPMLVGGDGLEPPTSCV